MAVRSFLPIALILAASPAAAEDVPLPPLTPEGEYLVMTQDDATSTSKCIGDPVTPMCAVETMLACFHRGEPELCRIGMGLDHDPGYGKTRLPVEGQIYRVLRSEILTASTLPGVPREDLPERPGQPNMRAGDARIDVEWRNCWTAISPDACDPPAMGTIAYIVRQEGNHWSVIYWAPGNDPRF